MIHYLRTSDLDERIKELEEELAEWRANIPESDKKEMEEAGFDLETPEDFDEYWMGGFEGEELQRLYTLKEEIGSAWEDICSLIPDTDFEEFAQDEAEELSLIRDSNAWPCNCIDWSKAADQLKSDYSQVEYDGETYWYRA